MSVAQSDMEHCLCRCKRSVGPWSQTVERVIHIEWRLLIEGW